MDDGFFVGKDLEEVFCFAFAVEEVIIGEEELLQASGLFLVRSDRFLEHLINRRHKTIVVIGAVEFGGEGSDIGVRGYG